MTRWTEENTEGFNAAELAEMNKAQEMLEADGFADADNLADMLNNAWNPEMTAADLYTAVRDAAGAN
ncbi:hypothetical protein [Paracoccus homiensis]|uniref:Uncharacterized protein n=1 Tax=Paracoccus homiensis TaxID=364199 RepID=A0A1I0IZS7_9RHOB|nr:hypothetical protein [Paracoccus homiensis]SEU02983.1 hypothetical protein SAMN04489858_12047 [Paracoccus homiensis]